MSMVKVSRRRAPHTPVSEPPSPERLHVCGFDNGLCRKAFARKSDLQRHMRIHNNDRPFKCRFKDCKKSFIQRSALTVHERSHTGERPHKCETCCKAFADSSSLARHRRIHTGNKPYQCIVGGCGKLYCRKVTLTRHYKCAHPELEMPSTYQVPGRSVAAPPLRPSRSLPSRNRKIAYTSGEDDDELHEIKYESEEDCHALGRGFSSRENQASGKRQRTRDHLPAGAHFTYAYSPISTRTRRGGMKPKVMPWQEDLVGGFQPDQLALADGPLPAGLGEPIRLQALYDWETQSDHPEYTPEPELIDICELPGLMTMEPLDPSRYSHSGRRIDHSPVLVHPQPIPLHVQVDTAAWAEHSLTYTPESADGENFDANYEEPCHLAFTPTPQLPGGDAEPEQTSESLWGPRITYSIVPHYSPASTSSTLVDGRSFSCTSATTISPLALSPPTQYSAADRKVSDGSLSVDSVPDSAYSPYTERFDGYYTPITPSSTYWHESQAQMHPQVVFLQPYNSTCPNRPQRVHSHSAGIGLGIANVSLGDESPCRSPSKSAPSPLEASRPVTEEEYDQLPDEAPTFIKQEQVESDDEGIDVMENDDDSDYVEERPKSRKKRKSK